MLTATHNKVLGNVPLNVKILWFNCGLNAQLPYLSSARCLRTAYCILVSLCRCPYAIFSYCFYASLKLAEATVSPEHMRLNIASIYRHTCSFFSAQKFVEHWLWTVRWGKTCKLWTSPSLVQCPTFDSLWGNLLFESFCKNYIEKKEPCRENLYHSLLLHPKCEI